ncbi:MAG: PPC domain-containing protein [Planctomycetaceae bacterium]|nr:PPC domain-containing protein [Planctomycetales bacterium]MCB9941861.1 PPC domain-containing protein [Planctomycetaceae bacterium]
MFCAPILDGAPPKCDNLFPTGGQRGQQVDVTAAGSFSNWPVSVWVDREGLQVEPDKDKGKFKVQIGDNANGVYLIRFHDKEGATQLRPFTVDSLPEMVEAEPNDDLSNANKLAESTIVNGRLEKSGDVDGFAIELKSGQTLVASLDANQTFGSPMDAVLQICTGDGFVIEQNDDQRGLDPQIAFEAPRDGVYVVRAFAFPLTPNSSIAFSGANTYIYRLTITTGGFIDHVFPLSLHPDTSTEIVPFGWNLPESVSLTSQANNDRDRLFASHPELASSVQQSLTTYPVVLARAALSKNDPQPLELPVVVTGRIDAERDEDVFQVHAAKGAKLSIQVESDSLGFLLDPLVQVLDAEGKVLGEIDDTNRQRDCLLTQAIPADGVYRVVVRDVHHHGGFRYVYRMTIDESTPDFALTLANDAFVLTPGKPLEIPVAVDRKNGFSDEIAVQAVELPEGIRCDVVKSEAKGDSAKSVKLVLNADRGPLSGTFRVLGKSIGDEPIERTADYVISGTTAQFASAWITVAASADNK